MSSIRICGKYECLRQTSCYKFSGTRASIKPIYPFCSDSVQFWVFQLLSKLLRKSMVYNVITQDLFTSSHKGNVSHLPLTSEVSSHTDGLPLVETSSFHVSFSCPTSYAFCRRSTMSCYKMQYATKNNRGINRLSFESVEISLNIAGNHCYFPKVQTSLSITNHSNA